MYVADESNKDSTTNLAAFAPAKIHTRKYMAYTSMHIASLC